MVRRFHERTCLETDQCTCVSCVAMTSFQFEKSYHVSRVVLARHPINAMVRIEENIIVTGDDSGIIRFWDHRMKEMTNPLIEYSNQKDYISSMVYVGNKRKLLVTR
jgi:hypothetical protein